MTVRIPATLALLLALLVGAWRPVPAQELTGTIKGVVLDQHTLQPLPGANVVLLGTQLGAIAGAEGQFTITQAPVGVQRLKVSMIGYTERVRPDLIV
ncbi:MAG: carboxypeptidase-like regulatory domain-containing protein [Candidatus Latescibacteria bacterium]|nr:carboxypeptidase-like regulatory domain-containing protein [Candidatus Latescibacterota bacterium]